MFHPPIELNTNSGSQEARFAEIMLLSVDHSIQCLASYVNFNTRNINISKISVIETSNCFNLHKNTSVSRNIKNQKGNGCTTIYTEAYPYHCVDLTLQMSL